MERRPAVSKSVGGKGYTTNQVVQDFGHKLYISSTYAKSHPHSLGVSLLEAASSQKKDL